MRSNPAKLWAIYPKKITDESKLWENSVARKHSVNLQGNYVDMTYILIKSITTESLILMGRSQKMITV